MRNHDSLPNRSYASLPGGWAGFEVGRTAEVVSLSVACLTEKMEHVPCDQWARFLQTHDRLVFCCSDLAHLLREAANSLTEPRILPFVHGLFALAEAKRLFDCASAWRLLYLSGRVDGPGLRNPAAVVRGPNEFGWTPELPTAYLLCNPDDRACWALRAGPPAFAEMCRVAAAAGVPDDAVAASGPLTAATQVRAVLFAFLSERQGIPLDRIDREEMQASARSWRDRTFRELAREPPGDCVSITIALPTGSRRTRSPSAEPTIVTVSSLTPTTPARVSVTVAGSLWSAPSVAR